MAVSMHLLILAVIAALSFPISVSADDQFGKPKGEEGTRIFKALEHPNYTGQFRISGRHATLVGSMHDQPPWDHLDYAGKSLQPVERTIEIEVNERTNTGRVVAEFQEGADQYRIVFDRFMAAQPFQDGGIATRVYEHGDSGNGDPLYPRPGYTLRAGERLIF